MASPVSYINNPIKLKINPTNPHIINMNNTNFAGEPSYTTGEDTGNTKRGVVYDVGFAFIVIFFILILIYTSYMCKEKKDSQSPLQRTITFRTTTDSDSDDSHCMKLSNGLDDDILSTLPMFLYSEAVKTYELSYGLGCSICFADYKPTDVIRLLPECGHLYHVKCIDKWLKDHSTCPVCRKSALPTTMEQVDLTDS